MPLELRTFEDSDVEASFSLAWRAHLSAKDGLATFCYSSDEIPPEMLKEMAEKRREAMGKDQNRFVLLKVVDTELDDQMIAYANWQFDINGRTPEELKAAMEPVPAPPDSPAPQAAADLSVYLAEARSKYLCLEPAAFLKGLVTDPKHHRRGAGSMLVKFGTDRADELGIRCYLEGTPAGRGLYERHGFKVLYEHTFDLTKYGGKGSQTDSVMERPAEEKAAH